MTEKLPSTPILPTVRLASAEMGGDAALAGFRDSVKDVFAVRLPQPDRPDRYGLDMTAWHLGPVMLVSVRSSALAFHRSIETISQGGLDHIMVQLYTEGGFIGTAADQPIEVRPGDICVFDYRGTLKTRTTAFHNITLVFPRSFFGGLADGAHSLNGLVLDRSRPTTEMLALHFISLAQRASRLNALEANSIARGTAALISAVIGSLPWTGGSEAFPAVSSPFRAVATFIDAHLGARDLQPEMVASTFGMSRATLYRVFEPVGGVSDYIRRRRLACAAVDLASSEADTRSIAQIAFKWGFGSEVVFGRSFKALFGVTPSQARARTADVLPANAWGGPHDTEKQRFALWMKTLRDDEAANR